MRLRQESAGTWGKVPGMPCRAVYKARLGGREVFFTLQDENGKLDLNNSSEDQIREVVRAILGDEELEAADTMVDGILDWRDSDKLVRLNGAEDDIYQDRSPPYYPANGPFHLLEELLLVRGVLRAHYLVIPGGRQ